MLLDEREGLILFDCYLSPSPSIGPKPLGRLEIEGVHIWRPIRN